MTRSRRRANEKARSLLEMGAAITDVDVLEMLRMWRFHKNKIRTNVMRETQTWVYSDTLGIVRSRDGRLCLTKPTLQYPAFMMALCMWVHDLRPDAFPEPFPFTSVA